MGLVLLLMIQTMCRSFGFMRTASYIKFDLIESRYMNKSLLEVEYIQTKIKELTDTDEDKTIQAEIDLSRHISAIGNTAKQIHNAEVKVSDNV